MSNILWGVAVFLLSLAGLQPWRLLEKSFLSTFQWRDLDRAFQTLHGHFVFYGPELTGGGHLPGGFYYWLLSVPLMLWPSWVAAWWWMVILAALAATAGFLFLKNRFALSVGFCWVGLFLFATNVQFFLTLFINPSYLFLFVTLATLGIVIGATSTSSVYRTRGFVLASAMIALSMQMHYSSASLLGALLTVAYMQRQRLTRQTVILSAASFFILLAPYLVWSMLHPGATQGGRVEDAVPTLLGMLSSMFSAPDLHFSISTAEMSYFMTPIVLPLMLLTLFVRDETSPPPRELKPLLVCLAWTFLPFCLCFFLPGARRYGAPFLISILLVTPIVALTVLQSTKRMQIYLILCATVLVGLLDWIFLLRDYSMGWESRKLILLTTFATLAWFFDLRHRRQGTMWWLAGVLSFFLLLVQMTAVRPDVRAQAMLSVGQWRTIWNYVYQRSPLPFEQLRERLYMVRGHCLEDARLSFEAMASKLGPVEMPANAPDGFLIAPGVTSVEVSNLRGWLLNQPIADDIKKSIAQGELRFDPPFFQDRVMIAGYHTAKPKILPAHFHNMGWGYHTPAWPQSTDEKSVVQTNRTDFVFSWNECQGHSAECASGMSVHLDENGKSARVRIFGQTLSQLTNWITPNWTQVWRQPYFQVKCGGKVHKFVLLDSIGLDERYMTSPRSRAIITRNSSLIAPLEKEIPMPCAHPEEMGVGRNGGLAAHLTERVSLPAAELNVGWPLK
jgi:hypothetical protein